MSNIGAMAGVMEAELKALDAAQSCIGDVWGVGLFWAIELRTDHEARTLTDVDLARAAALHAHANGLYVLTTGNRLILAPPLCVSEDEIREGISLLAAALSAAEADVASKDNR